MSSILSTALLLELEALGRHLSFRELMRWEGT